MKKIQAEDPRTFEFKVVEILEDPETGEARVFFDVSDSFKKWFINHQNLKRWSQKRFQKFFIETLENHLKKISGEEKNVNEDHDILR